MNYLLFAVYLLVLCWLLLRIPFIRHSGISKKVLTVLFLIKVAAGIAIGWLSLHYYGGENDYWNFNREGWNEYQLMVNDPVQYLGNLFSSGYPGGYSGIFSSHDSYWNDLRGNIVIKLLSVFNIFSRGDYYINSLFFNFLIFFGHVMLYRLFMRLYPGKQFWVITGCFLLPSMLYFSSGIHKDGLIFLMLSACIYAVFQSLQKNKFNAKRTIIIVVSLLLIFMIRNFIFLALLPALTAWIISAKTRGKPWLSFVITYMVAGILFFTMASLTGGRIDPLAIIVSKQTEYLSLGHSDTQIELTPLKPGPRSFVSGAAEALNHAFLRPYLWELPVNPILPLSIELFIYQLLLLVLIFFHRKETGSSNLRFLLFSAFFVFTVFLLIGYIVPNLGSIVRYRSLYLPLIITPLLCSIEWKWTNPGKKN